MYSIVAPFKGLTLEISHQEDLYHYVTDYDRIIAYAWLEFVVIDMEAMITYPADIKLRHA